MSEGIVAAATRTPLEERRHPLHVFAGRLSAALDELAGTSTLSTGVAETAETTVELTRAVCGCGRCSWPS